MKFFLPPYARLLLGVAITVPGLLAAQTFPVPLQIAEHGTGEIPLQAKSISIDAKNRSIESILNEIVEKGKVRLFFSPENPAFQIKTTVVVRQVSPLDAITAAIRGTNLIVAKTADGQGIMIRPKDDSTSKAATNVKGTIVGVVIDSATKQPVAGATVTIDGLNITKVTDQKGVFRMTDVPPGKYRVLFRMLGYASKSTTVTVSDDRAVTVEFVVASSAASLSEVVTTATGQQRRVEIAHDIAKIDPQKIMERTPVRNVIDVLEAAQVPGLLVERGGGDPGSPARIRIRGIGSISESNDPVFILDGVWIDGKVSKPSRVDDLDPASIETIEVIRGPSAATLFGQDASNGVIVITTKKGKAGPTRWNLSYSRDWGQTYGRNPLFYAGIGTRLSSAEVVSCPVKSVVEYDCIQDSVVIIDPNHKLLSREGVETNNRYSLQMDGGSDNVTYNVTLSLGNTIGVRRTSGVDKIRYRMMGYQPTGEYDRPSEMTRSGITTGLVFTPRANLTLGMTLTGAQTHLKDNFLSSSWYGLPIRSSVSPAYISDTVFAPYGSVTIIPTERPIRTTSALISSSVQYRPRGSIVMNGNFGVEKTTKNESEFSGNTRCSLIAPCTDTTGSRRELGQRGSVYTARMNASTSLNLGSFNRYLDIRPSIGGDYRKTDDNMLTLYKDDIPIGDRSMNSGKFLSSLTYAVENATAGWYVNSTIGLFQRVYFDVGIRQDIGSAITSSKNAMYPKIGGSWLVSDESFWRPNAIVNTLRIRSALGHSAVQPSLGDINGKFVNGVEYIDGKFVNTVRLDGTGNIRLRPERAVEVELGFDADMFNDKLNVIATYAHKENKNTLIEKGLPPSLGTDFFGKRKENVARVRNRNVELSANARAIEVPNALLILNYTLTLSDNKVMHLGDGVTPFGDKNDRVATGYPLAGIWSQQVLGYRDVNRDGMLSANEIVLSDSIVYLGWGQPRYRAGYGVSFTLHNQLVFDSRFAYQSRYIKSYQPLLRYGAEDVNAPLTEQAVAIVDELGGRRSTSDLRWNSASITYHVPQNLLKRFGGRSVSVALQGSNLGLWTNYVGRDPGVTSNVLTKSTPIDDGMTPPMPRKYVLDFKVGL